MDNDNQIEKQFQFFCDGQQITSESLQQAANELGLNLKHKDLSAVISDAFGDGIDFENF